MSQQGNKTKTRTRIRPTINDSLNESLKDAQNLNKRKNVVKIVEETKKEKKLKGKTHYKYFSKPKFGIDDSEVKKVSIEKNIRVDRIQAETHFHELKRSRFSYENDKDEEYVNNGVTEDIGYQNTHHDDTPLIGNGKPQKTSYDLIKHSLDIDVLKDNIPKFIRIKDTPGYQQRMIRQLGRTIFRTIPTYRKMEEMCREAGVDPQGQIRTISTVTDTSPYHRKAIEQVASWILANGKDIDSRENDFGKNFNVMHGYKPREVIATTDDMTFLLVHEDERSPMGEQYYIYSFQGGNIPNLENAGEKYSYEKQKKAALSNSSTIKPKEIDIVHPKKDDFPSPF